MQCGNKYHHGNKVSPQPRSKNQGGYSLGGSSPQGGHQKRFFLWFKIDNCLFCTSTKSFSGESLDGKITELSGKRKSYLTVKKKCLQKKEGQDKQQNYCLLFRQIRGKTPKH